MSTILKLTGLRYHEVGEIADCLVIGNAAFITKEPALDKDPERSCDGFAYRCECKGKLIGYIPLIRTIKKYYNEAITQEAQARVREWGIACRAVRNQLATDWGHHNRESWTVVIAGLLYERDGKWIEFEEFSHRADADKWTLRQVAVRFDEVEMF